MEAIEKTMNDSRHDGDKLTFQQLFSCEIEPTKRQWIDGIINGPRRREGKDLVCIFGDIRHMGQASAHCYAHDRHCPTPSVDILVVSTSCKDLSALSNAKFPVPVLSLITSQGGSADTWRGLLAYLDTHFVEVVFYENSDRLDTDGTAAQKSGEVQNIDVFEAEVASRGYEGQNLVLNAKLFGLPQNRRRFWAVLVKAANTSSSISWAGRDVTCTFQTLRALVQVCQRQPPSAEELLLAADDAAVEKELLRRVSAGEANTDPNRSWIPEHQFMHGQLRISWGAPPPHAESAASPWLRTVTPLQKSTLTLHQHKLLSSGRALSTASGQAVVAKEAAPTALGQAPIKQVTPWKLMVDVHPSPGRLRSSTEHGCGSTIAPCMLPHQSLWLHVARPRLLLGREALLFQGYPISEVKELLASHSEGLLQDLAGNAVALPVLLAVVQSTLEAISWRKVRIREGASSSSAEVEDAMALLDGLL